MPMANFAFSVTEAAEESQMRLCWSLGCLEADQRPISIGLEAWNCEIWWKL